MFNFAATFRGSIKSSSQSFQAAKHPECKGQCKGQIKGAIRKTVSQNIEEANSVTFKASGRCKMVPHEPFQTNR